MFLQCQIHQKKITHINSQQDAIQGTRIKCEDCQIIGTFAPLSEFEIKLKERRIIAEQKQQEKLNELGKLSVPLEKLLNNYREEFNSTIQNISKENEKIKQKIHEYYSITDQALDSQSLSEFEKICHKVYSNLTDELDLKSYYTQLIFIIQELINMQKNYSQRITKCFKQLQNDMINYEFQYNFNVSGPKVCTAMCMGQDNDGQLVALALGNVLKTYGFCLKKKIAEEIDCFNDFTHNIGSMAFSEDYKYLLAGGTFDTKMNIYSECQTKKKYQLKTIILYDEPIFSIIFTQNNDDLISASGNNIYCITNEKFQQIIDEKQEKIKKIAFNENTSNYQLEQAHSNTVYQLSPYYTKSKQKFISCSYDKQILIWLKNDKWNVINKIRVQNSVYRCCFIGEDDIVIQENSSRELTFYNNVSQKKDSTQKFKFNDLNTDLSHTFPIIYNEYLKLLIVKHNSKIVFLKKRKNDQFYKEDEQDGEMGTITNDGKIFLKWDKINQKVEIYKQNSKFQITKEEFENKFFDSNSNISEDSSTRSKQNNQSVIDLNSQRKILDTKILKSNSNSNSNIIKITKDVGINTDNDKLIVNQDQFESSDNLVQFLD